MEIYLIRHTTPKIEKGICYGHSDIELAKSFDEEVKTIKQQLPLGDGLVVYTSPLKRCLKLAGVLSKNPILDYRLMEMNFGEWEMQRWDEIEKAKLDKWMGNFVDVICPGGESYAILYKRSIEFYIELKLKKHTKTAVITHAGVIRSILAYTRNNHLEDSFDIKVGYGEVFRLSLPDSS